MNLVIVESPTKARTIRRFLGNDYDIRASMGHIMDLPKSKLGVDVEHDFKPEYEVMADKKGVLADLKAAAKKADNVILATDPDREGEAIGAHVAELLGFTAKQRDKLKRIVFHEITNEAIQEAIKNPRTIDENLVDAQTARRVLDRLVGYKLSPLLWTKVRRGLSAGRVQSIALRLIVEREREIEKFKKSLYWSIHVILNSIQDLTRDRNEMLNQVQHDNEKGVEFELLEIDGKKIELQSSSQLYDGEYKVTKTLIDSEIDAQKIVEQLQGKEFLIADLVQKEMRRSPQPPYITSTLQQDASRRLGYSGKRTMMLAQKLYEEGHITYHRTDSVNVSQAAITAIRAYVGKEYGEKYTSPQPRVYVTKQKLAQEAHEAIRPTHIDTKVSSLGRDYDRLYDLIWRRAVASQMADAITESTSVLADSQKTDKVYRFKANGSVLVFDGFLKVNAAALQDKKLPDFKVAEHLESTRIDGVKHETAPPPRYNDASIIKTLEEKGIGRPSTYASIISTIQARSYIEREENRFIPTSVGMAVNDFLVENFPEIDDIPFTAQMEDDLDEIAHGRKKWVPIMKEFYEPFAKKLGETKNVERVKIETEQTDEKCPECKQANLVVRTGKFGKFLSCSRFPDCKFSKPFVEETGLKCPKDGGSVIVKKTRKGRKFFGCGNYPNCDFAAWKLEDIPGAKVVAPQEQGAPQEPVVNT